MIYQQELDKNSDGCQSKSWNISFCDATPFEIVFDTPSFTLKGIERYMQRVNSQFMSSDIHISNHPVEYPFWWNKIWLWTKNSW